MSCPILSKDFTLDCAMAQGGISELLITELSNIESLAIASGVATITKVSGKRFFKYKVSLGGGNAVSVPTTARATSSKFYAQTVTMNIPKFNTALRNEMEILTSTPVAVIVKDMMGSYFLYGAYNGLQNGGGGLNTGTASGDGNMYVLTMTGEEFQDVFSIDAAAIAGLITA